MLALYLTIAYLFAAAGFVILIQIVARRHSDWMLTVDKDDLGGIFILLLASTLWPVLLPLALAACFISYILKKIDDGEK